MDGALAPQRPLRRFRAYDGVRVVFGVLLLAAAGLKALHIENIIGSESGMLASRWILILSVEFELALGVALIAGLFLNVTRWTAICTFGAFSGISLYRVVTGADSCGCLGQVVVNPWLMFAVDMTALAAFAFCYPSPRPEPIAHVPGDSRGPQSKRRRLVIACVAFAGLGIAAALLLARSDRSTLSVDGQLAGDSSTAVLDPDEWVHKTFPLREHIDIGSQLAIGRWTVVLYHRTCPKCQALIADMEAAMARSFGDMSYRIALIEVPPFGDRIHDRISSRAFIHGRLSTRRDWHVRTPVVLDLKEGMVIHVSTGEILPVSYSDVPRFHVVTTQ